MYRLERGANGETIRWKARWVAKGYEQRHGIDYDQMFVGVTKLMTWKAIIAMAATYNLVVGEDGNYVNNLIISRMVPAVCWPFQSD
jgi:Reverse transcriptase (RNA-dependent DNA polymerase)